MNASHLHTLTSLAIHASLGNKEKLRALISRRGFLSIPRRKVDEALLEIHLFAGFPATIEAFITLQESGTRGKGGLLRPAKDTRRDRILRGKKMCQRVYGSNYMKLIARMKLLHPTLEQWIVEDGYGKVLSRPGLSPIERECVAIASLAVLGWQRQLDSHIRGAINLGAKRAILQSVFMAVAPYVSKRRLHHMSKAANIREFA